MTCDGSPVDATCDPVPEYANVYPWGQERPGTLIRYINNPGRRWTLYWRYATRSWGYVMARDPHIDERDGNWVFVPRSCFGSLPNEVPISN